MGVSKPGSYKELPVIDREKYSAAREHQKVGAQV